MKKYQPRSLKPAAVLLGCAALFSTALCQTTFAQAPGSVDPTFSVGVGPSDNEVRALALQADGKIIVGGTFTMFDNLPQTGIARINADGTLDATFNPGTGIAFDFPDSGVYAVGIQADGKIIVAGIFDMFNGTATSNIVRLNADGSLDGTLTGGTGIDDGIRSLAIQPDGKIVIAGSFATVNGAPVNALARLNADGSTDATYRTSGVFSDGSLVYQVALQSDGKIVGVGNFTAGDYTNLARFTTTGDTDGTFNPDDFGNNEIYTVAIEYDGKIIIGGPIMFDGEVGSQEVTRTSVARLNADGSLDLGFDTDLGTSDFDPYSIVFQADGKAVVGGFLSASGPGPQGVVRLNTDGSVDSTFSVGTGTPGVIDVVAIQPDNNILAGGGYVGFEGSAANYLTRVVGGPLGAIPTPTPTPNPTPSPTPNPTPNPTPGGTLPTLTIVAQSSKPGEKSGKDKVTITRTGDLSSDLTVSYSAKGTAVNKVNYKGLSGSVVIPAGSDTAVIKLKLLDDMRRDDTVVLKLTLLPSDAYTIGSAGKVKIKILNQD